MESLIQAQDLTKVYQTGDQICTAVDHVSLSIYKGEKIAIVGPSGCGKTTLLHMLGGLLLPSSGSLYICQRPFHAYSSKEKARLRNEFFSYIIQQFALIEEDSVKKNLLLPLILSSRKQNRQLQNKKIDEILSLFNLFDKKNELVKNLSGGQKQRVAIARALIQDSQLLLADEPTGSLDSKMSIEIFYLLSDLVKNHKKTLILVTHNELLANQCDRIYQMKDGKLLS